MSAKPEGRVESGSHWVTWLLDGEEALAVQVKDSGKTSDPMFFVLRSTDTVVRLKNVKCGFVSGPSRPTTVLRGTLAAKRTRWRNGHTSYENERVATLQSMLPDGRRPAYDALPDSPCNLVFFATECFWWRTTVTEDFQGRMVQARILTELGADQGSCYASGFAAAANAPHIAYQPHMAPPQSLAVTRDVPRGLVGCSLRGLSLRPVDEASHEPFDLAGAGEDDYEGTVKSLAVDK